MTLFIGLLFAIVDAFSWTCVGALDYSERKWIPTAISAALLAVSAAIIIYNSGVNRANQTKVCDVCKKEYVGYKYFQEDGNKLANFESQTN